MAEETGETDAGKATTPSESVLLRGGVEEPQVGQKKPAQIPIIQLPPWATKPSAPHTASVHETAPHKAVRKEEEMHIASSAVSDIPIERNLREVGLKESLLHQGTAPERLGIGDIDPKTGTLPRIRTYAADMGDEMKKRNATLSTIIGAEKAREEISTTPQQAKTGRRWFFLAGATFFILVGATAIAIVIFVQTHKSEPPAIRTSLIPVNKRVDIPLGDGKNILGALAAEKSSASLSLGEIEEITVASNGSPATPEQVLLALGAPNELARNATGVLIGVHAFNHSQPFILVSVSAYDFAFHAMLQWEATIGDTLGAYFAPNETPSVRAPPLIFTDGVADNVDVRHSQTDWPVVWGFPRQNLLVITTNEYTLREVITRLSLQRSAGQ